MRVWCVGLVDTCRKKDSRFEGLFCCTVYSKHHPAICCQAGTLVEPFQLHQYTRNPTNQTRQDQHPYIHINTPQPPNCLCCHMRNLGNSFAGVRMYTLRGPSPFCGLEYGGAQWAFYTGDCSSQLPALSPLDWPA